MKSNKLELPHSWEPTQVTTHITTIDLDSKQTTHHTTSDLDNMLTSGGWDKDCNIYSLSINSSSNIRKQHSGSRYPPPKETVTTGFIIISWPHLQHLVYPFLLFHIFFSIYHSFHPFRLITISSWKILKIEMSIYADGLISVPSCVE